MLLYNNREAYESFAQFVVGKNVKFETRYPCPCGKEHFWTNKHKVLGKILGIVKAISEISEVFVFEKTPLSSLKNGKKRNLEEFIELCWGLCGEEYSLKKLSGQFELSIKRIKKLKKKVRKQLRNKDIFIELQKQ